jgi:class 3 adenylate cyclase/tetratricopeptide (TPR) repeat protein
VSARERKVVTVLFADLVGFTARSEQLDPEDVDAMLGPYHERLRYELERWGGTVEKFIGDAVVAFFGAPVAGEDDPERAVRAALAIRDWIVEEGTLQVRIAVNTGEALVRLGARPESGEGMATGDVVNTASRLQSAARTNGILVGETTYRATAERIEYREHEAVDAKGKEESVPVWEVVEARARFGVDLAPEERTPLVGREREVELLVGTLGRARQQRSPELVTLIGVPGIGKSRLVGELFQSIERGGELTYWRQGRSLPYGEGVSYWALAEMVKAQAGILETDSDEEVGAKLAETVERLLDEDVEWVLSHLRPLVGQTADSAGSQEEAFAAWRRFFEALAEEHALVLVFEDIQWADDGLLDFIEHLVDWVRDVPMLILCTARLELLERRAAWGGGKLNAANVALAPLSGEETAKLIAALSERPLLEAELQAELLDRAGGNPLYAEQYVRMLAERGTVAELPESVQGIIAARLDALAPEEKSVVQDAAVMGKVFWLGALGVSEQQLHALQQKEFVQRARRSSVAGETEFSFKHVLVRDVAYGQIPRADRAAKHLRTAEWIESLGRPDDHAEMVAHHYANALELTRASGGSPNGLVTRTRDALRDAGVRAASLNAVAQAERYFTEALELTERDDPERVQLLYKLGAVKHIRSWEGSEELAEARDGFVAAGDPESAVEAVLRIADNYWSRGQGEEVRAQLDQARSLVAGRPPSRTQAQVLEQAARYAMLGDRNEEAIATGREALRMAEELGLDDIRARVFNNIGAARVAGGDPGGIEDLDESLELATQLNIADEIVRAWNNRATMKLLLGRLGDAKVDLAEAYRLAQHFGHRGFVRWFEGGPMIGWLFSDGQWDEVVERATAFIDGLGGEGHYQAASSYMQRGMVRAARGEDAAATEDAARTLEVARPVGDPQLTGATLLGAAFIYMTIGDGKRAGELLDQSLGFIDGLGDLGWLAVELNSLAWVAQKLGRGEEVLAAVKDEQLETPWLLAARAIAAGDFVRAAGIFSEMGDVSLEAFYRLCAAEALVAEGRRAEADEQLHAALAFYRSVGATRYVHEGEALLAASA